ncbi:hypothetical protein Gpo141_00009076 [Globisporangium polare]
MESSSVATHQAKTTRKRPREELHGERPAVQTRATEAVGSGAMPPVPVSRDHHAHEPSSPGAHSPCKKQYAPASASTPPSPSVVNKQAIVHAPTLQSGVESDDVEEQLMRALEEELEAPRAGAPAAAAQLFQDADEDDNYDESDDDDEE